MFNPNSSLFDKFGTHPLKPASLQLPFSAMRPTNSIDTSLDTANIDIFLCAMRQTSRRECILLPFGQSWYIPRSCIFFLLLLCCKWSLDNIRLRFLGRVGAIRIVDNVTSFVLERLSSSSSSSKDTVLVVHRLITSSTYTVNFFVISLSYPVDTIDDINL